MLLTERKCFEIAIQITKQHNKEDLIIAFKKILKEIFPNCIIISHEVINGTLVEENSKYSVLLNQYLLNQSITYSENNNHDALTGLLNRHSFEERIHHVVNAFQRRNNEQSPQYCFAILDIDFFKKENGRNQVNSFEELVYTGKLLDKSTNVGDIELF